MDHSRPECVQMVVSNGSKRGTKWKMQPPPTVSTNWVILPGVVGAHENRDVAVIYIPGVFLHALTDKEVIMQLKGRLAKLMIMIKSQAVQEVYHGRQQGGSLFCM